MKTNKNFLIWTLIFLGLLMAFNIKGSRVQNGSREKLAFSDFMHEAENKHVAEVVISGPDIKGKMTDGSTFYTYAPYDPSMVETLRQSGTKVVAEPVDTSSSTFWGIFVSYVSGFLLFHEQKS